MKIGILLKVIKWEKLCEISKSIGIGLWYVHVYATALICELCIYSVAAFELVDFDFGEIIGKG